MMVGRVAVVTGAGQGLGEEIAAGLAAQGYRVALLGRTPAKLARVQARIGDDSLAFRVDLTDPQAVREAFDAVDAEFGSIDVLVNNAATYVPFLLGEASDEELRMTVDGTLMSALYCIREAITRMEPRGTGDIVSVTSEGVRFPAPFLTVYAAAKAALHKVHEAMRKELQGTGIRSMVFETGRITANSTAEHWDQELVQRFNQRFMDLGYFGGMSLEGVSPESLAATIVHMIDAPRDGVIELVQMRSGV